MLYVPILSHTHSLFLWSDKHAYNWSSPLTINANRPKAFPYKANNKLFSVILHVVIGFNKCSITA